MFFFIPLIKRHILYLHPFIHSFFYIFKFIRKRASERQGLRERETSSSMFPVECGADLGPVQDPEIMTCDKIRSWTSNHLSHPGGPFYSKIYISAILFFFSQHLLPSEMIHSLTYLFLLLEKKHGQKILSNLFMTCFICLEMYPEHILCPIRVYSMMD